MLWRTITNRDNFFRSVLVFFSALQLAPAFLKGTFPAWLDSKLYFMPFRELTAEAVRQGVMPFWNAMIYCGNPLMANMQSAVFYPLNILFYIFSPSFAGIMFMMAGSVILSLFMYEYLRCKNMSEPAAFTGAAIMAFGYYMSIRLVEFADYHVIAWMPAVLLFTLRFAQKRKLHDAVLSVLSITMSLLAGHPQVFAYCMLLAALMYIYENPKGAKLRAGFEITAAAFIAALIALPQVISTLEFISQSKRVDSGFGYALSASTHMAFEHLVSLFLPFLSEFLQKRIAFMNWAAHIDIGAAGIVLVIAAFFLAKERKFINYLFLLFAAALFLAVLGNTAFYKEVFKIFPWLTTVRYPVKINIIMLFALSALAAAGFDAAFGAEKRDKVKGFGIYYSVVMLFMCVMLALLSFFREKVISIILLLYGSKPKIEDIYEMVIRYDQRFMILFIFFALLTLATAAFVYYANRTGRIGKYAVLVLIPMSLWMQNGPFDSLFVDYEKVIKSSPQVISYVKQNTGNFRILAPGLYDNLDFNIISEDDNAVMKYVMDSLPPNSPMLHGIKNAAGFDSLNIGRFTRFTANISGMEDPWELPSFALFSSKYISSKPKLKGSTVKEKISAATRVYEYSRPLDIVFFVPKKFQREMQPEDILKRMKEKDFDPRSEILFERSEQIKLPLHDGSARVKWESKDMNTFDISVDTPNDGYIVITDNWYPGWKATVNGKKENILRAYYTFKAIPVEKGESKVHVSFVPSGFYPALILAFALILLLCAAPVFAGDKK